MKTILLTIDLTDERTNALRDAALDLARQHSGAAIHVVSVLPPFAMPQLSGYFPKGFEENAMKGLGRDLEAWAAENIPGEIRCRTQVLHGTVYDEVLRAAKELSADVIIVGSHRPTLSDYLLGPNAARIVRHANCSVYVVRS